MPPRLSVDVEELNKLKGRDRFSQESSLVDILPTTPLDFTASTRTNHVLFQWKPVDEAGGYELVISSDQEFDSPDFVVHLDNKKFLSFPFFTGNISTLYYGKIRSVLGQERSEFSDVQSARSIGSGAHFQSATLVNSTFNDSEDDIVKIDSVTLVANNVAVIYSIEIDTDSSVNAFTATTRQESLTPKTLSSITSTSGKVVITGVHSYVFNDTELGKTKEIKVSLKNTTDTDVITVNSAQLICIVTPDSADTDVPATSPGEFRDIVIKPGSGGFK